MSHKTTRTREVTAYYDYMKRLQEKYGLPSGPYFLPIGDTGRYRKNLKLSRTKEGLYIHHTEEIIMPALSSGLFINEVTYVFQQPHKLAYCNIFEHLLAHIMIAEALITDHDYIIFEGAGLGGIKMIIGLLNDWYGGSPPKETDWQYSAWLSVKDRQSEYKGLLKRAQRAMCTLGKSGSLKKVSFEKNYRHDKYTRDDSLENETISA